jgi:cobalamin biosynthesis protein CobD/CbiB
MRKLVGLCRDTGRLVVVALTTLVVSVTIVVPPMLVVAVEVTVVTGVVVTVVFTFKVTVLRKFMKKLANIHSIAHAIDLRSARNKSCESHRR